MSDTYYYFTCLNHDCGQDVTLDISVKDGGKEFTAFDCPVCSKPMDFRGRSAADADGYPVRLAPDTLRDIIKLVLIRIGKMRNPWTHAAMSSNDLTVAKSVTDWYQTQIELGRSMVAVVFGGEAATEKLLRRGLDFLWGRS